MTFGNGLFVAVADSGTNRVMTSPDGIAWTARTAPAFGWGAVTYGQGTFVAVGNAGADRVMTSSDGITWTSYDSASDTNSWQSVTFGNGLFVAVSADGTNRVMTSPDGMTWTPQTAAEANQWRSVAYGNGLFVAVTNAGTNRVMTSPDGITWTARVAAEANFWLSVTYGNGLFVAVSWDGTNRVMTSPDGITWTARMAAEANQWRSVSYGNGLFVALAQTGTNRVMTSPDGITWTAHAAEENAWYSAIYGNGLFVAVSNSGMNRVMTAECLAPDCTGPSEPAGNIIFNGEQRVLQWCGGGTWHAAGPVNPPGPNAGCTSPARPGGYLQFNRNVCQLEYCDGDNWRSIGKRDPDACDCPNIGDVCNNGMIHAGLSPDGNQRMFTTPANLGDYTWNDGSTNDAYTGMTVCYGPEASCRQGEANTTFLVGLSGSGSPAPYLAAEACANLTAHGRDDWYLPAVDELAVMCANRGAGALAGSFSTPYYWSSSEVWISAAAYLDCDGGSDGGSGAKHFSNRVRCVRK